MPWFEGDEIFASGWIRNGSIYDGIYGISGYQWIDVYFIYSDDRGENWYNYKGTNLTSILPLLPGTRDSIKVIDTDTLYTNVITGRKINGKFYAFYLLEDSLDSGVNGNHHLNIAEIDYLNHTYTNYETNLSSRCSWSCFDVQYKDGYYWLLGNIGNNQISWQDYYGNAEIYRSQNLTTWTKYDDLTTDAASAGGQLILNSENMIYFLYSDGISGHTGNCYLYMKR
jgi:hypothetical protein